MTLLYEVGNRCVRIGNDIQRCLDEILETAITFTGADKVIFNYSIKKTAH